MDWVAIVSVVVGVPTVFGAGLAAYRRHVTFKERQLELTADRTAERAAQYAAQVERLEERLRVLERIATANGVNLAEQIESLRDEPTRRLATTEGELN